MNWNHVGAVDDWDEDEVKGVEVGGHSIAVFRIGGEFYATSNICTHQLAYLSDGYVEDGCIECPLHQGRFDIKTGAALCAPVTEPLATYPVRVEADHVAVSID